MRKKSIIIFLIFAFAFSFLSLTGCEASIEAEKDGDKYFYDSASGEIHKDLSDRFDFKIENWKYYFDKESDQDRILFSVAIKNKTEERLDNFVAKIILNEEALDFIASGITEYNIFEPCDLIPQTTANGASYSFDLLVEKDEWLSEIGADKNELLDKVRNITLNLSWDGGEETVLIICDELKKDEE